MGESLSAVIGVVGSRPVVRCAAATIALLLASPPTSSLAEGAGGPMVLWDRAREAREQADYPLAERLLRQAYEASPAGYLACDLAEVLDLRGRHASAVLWLDRCAGHEDVDAATRARALDQSAALRHRSGVIRLRGGREGDRVTLDGAAVGIAPVTEDVTVSAGRHRVRVRSGDGVSEVAEHTVEVLGGRATTVDLRSLTTAPAPPLSRGSAPAWALWMTLAVTVAAATGAGIALWYDVQYSPLSWGEEEAEGGLIASAVLGGVAGLGLATTLVLIPYVLSPRSEERPRVAARRRSRRPTLFLGLGTVGARWP